MPSPEHDVLIVASDESAIAKFESIDEALKENAIRVDLLESSRSSAARRLALRLKATTSVERTFASPLYVREIRRRLVGYSLSQTASQAVYHTTLVSAKGTIPLKELSARVVQRHTQRFRKQLVRIGCDKAGGFLSAWLHGDYNPIRKVFQLHWHIIHTANHIPLLKALSKQRAYRPSEYVAVPRRTVLIRDGWIQHSYAHQGFWYCRGRVPGMSNKPVKGRHRIPGRAHTRYLLTMDALRFSDTYISYPPILKK